MYADSDDEDVEITGERANEAVERWRRVCAHPGTVLRSIATNQARVAGCLIQCEKYLHQIQVQPAPVPLALLGRAMRVWNSFIFDQMQPQPISPAPLPHFAIHCLGREQQTVVGAAACTAAAYMLQSHADMLPQYPTGCLLLHEQQVQQVLYEPDNAMKRAVVLVGYYIQHRHRLEKLNLSVVVNRDKFNVDKTWNTSPRLVDALQTLLLARLLHQHADAMYGDHSFVLGGAHVAAPLTILSGQTLEWAISAQIAVTNYEVGFTRLLQVLPLSDRVGIPTATALMLDMIEQSYLWLSIQIQRHLAIHCFAGGNLVTGLRLLHGIQRQLTKLLELQDEPDSVVRPVLQDMELRNNSQLTMWLPQLCADDQKDVANEQHYTLWQVIPSIIPKRQEIQKQTYRSLLGHTAWKKYYTWQ